MLDQDNRNVPRQRADHVEDPRSLARSKAGAGLVEKQHLGTSVQRQCELELAAFPIGQELDRLVGAVRQTDSFKPGERLLANGRERRKRLVHNPLAPVGADDRENEIFGQR